MWGNAATTRRPDCPAPCPVPIPISGSHHHSWDSGFHCAPLRRRASTHRSTCGSHHSPCRILVVGKLPWFGTLRFTRVARTTWLLDRKPQDFLHEARNCFLCPRRSIDCFRRDRFLTAAALLENLRVLQAEAFMENCLH